MTEDLDEGVRMTTPLEDAVLKSFIDRLREESVDETILDELQSAFVAERLPGADTVVEFIKNQSGDKLA